MIAVYSSKIENLMYIIEKFINYILRKALRAKNSTSGPQEIYFDILTYGGTTGMQYRYININSSGIISNKPLKIYFNCTVIYKRKHKC